MTMTNNGPWGQIMTTNVVLDIIFSLFKIRHITALGSTCKSMKAAAIKELKKRADCMLTHITKPSQWTFRFMHINDPTIGPPFWGACFGCEVCEDIHWQDIYAGGGETLNRTWELQQFTPNHTGAHHFQALIEIMRPVYGLKQ